MSNKNHIRKLQLAKRNQLTSKQVSEFSKQLVKLLISHSLVHSHQSIAFYLAVNNEVDLSDLLQFSAKKFLLPCIQTDHTMVFKQISMGDKLIKNQFGIPEPSPSLAEFTQHIDLCLMPLVAFNRQGHRIGMGGGYYDRYFADNRLRQKPTILAGIAYDFQESDTIKNDPWDIPLDVIFTNKEVILP